MRIHYNNRVTEWTGEPVLSSFIYTDINYEKDKYIYYVYMKTTELML